MTTDPAVILRDIISAGLDDCNILLPPATEQRLVDRVTELAELAGVTVAVEVHHPEPHIY